MYRWYTFEPVYIYNFVYILLNMIVLATLYESIGWRNGNEVLIIASYITFDFVTYEDNYLHVCMYVRCTTWALLCGLSYLYFTYINTLLLIRVHRNEFVCSHTYMFVCTKYCIHNAYAHATKLHVYTYIYLLLISS